MRNYKTPKERLPFGFEDPDMGLLCLSGQIVKGLWSMSMTLLLYVTREFRGFLRKGSGSLLGNSFLSTNPEDMVAGVAQRV